MKITENGITLSIGYDEFAENPRNWDNVGTMVCFHRRYMLGDKHNYNDLQEFFNGEDYNNAFVIKPLFLYDHSGISLSTKSFNGRVPYAEWDSMQVGYIFIRKDEVKDKLGFEPIDENREQIERMIESEVAVYNNYLEGNTFEYSLRNEDEKIIESCGGFIADSVKEAITMMKDYTSVEYESLFNKLEKQLCSETVM